MKVLFLDIDGVLNSQDWMDRGGAAGWSYEDDTSQLDPAAVLRLQKIVELSGAKVVISSSWRKSNKVYGVPSGKAFRVIAGFLKHHGFRGEVIGETVHWIECWDRPEGKYQRGWEIKRWVDEHPEITHYAILDDDSDMAGVEAHFVHTKNQHGLLDEHIPQVLKLLDA